MENDIIYLLERLRKEEIVLNSMHDSYAKAKKLHLPFKGGIYINRISGQKQLIKAIEDRLQLLGQS